MTLKSVDPIDGLWRCDYAESARRLEVEEPLPHAPDCRLVKYRLFNSLADEFPNLSRLGSLGDSKIDEVSDLLERVVIGTMEFAERMMSVVPVLADESKVRLSNRPHTTTRLGRAHDLRTKPSARGALDVGANPVAPSRLQVAIGAGGRRTAKQAGKLLYIEFTREMSRVSGRWHRIPSVAIPFPI
jgi:hypothetical protein